MTAQRPGTLCWRCAAESRIGAELWPCKGLSVKLKLEGLQADLPSLAVCTLYLAEHNPVFEERRLLGPCYQPVTSVRPLCADARPYMGISPAALARVCWCMQALGLGAQCKLLLQVSSAALNSMYQCCLAQLSGTELRALRAHFLQVLFWSSCYCLAAGFRQGS